MQRQRIDASKIGGGTVSNAEFGYLDGLTGGIQNQINTILNPPRAQYRSSIDKIIPSGTWISPDWDVQVIDTDSFITSAGIETVVINKSGMYFIQATIGVSVSNLGIRNMKILKNETEEVAYNSNASGGAYSSRNNVTAMLILNVGETLRIQVFQDTGGNLTLMSSLSKMSIIRLCPP